MTHQRIDLRIETGRLSSGRSWTLAATVHLPALGRHERPPVLVCLPGGGYSRRYFDLQGQGYSEAEHHVTRGVVVIAIDHLRVGESDIPALDDASLAAAAEADHAVVQTILERLRSGRLVEGTEAINPAAVIGEGQSMGGHIGLLMQANHRSFDGLAMLGGSVTCTRLPARLSGHEICLLGQQALTQGAAVLADFDWRFAFHWEDVPEHFADVDVASKGGGVPMPYWGSATTPDAGDGLLPGTFSREAARVDVPVLIGMGERDVCQDPLRELAAFISARDLAVFVTPRMAHMHNFAGTRELLWNRLTAFIHQVTAQRRHSAN
jgi:alpha-beta hydrolase superfamily lysophospholipase